MQRICVLGLTGSGKTTLARRVAARLGIPHVELDALHWGRDWTPVEKSVFRARTAAATRGDAWVTDGNYSAVRDLLWPQADTFLWIDMPFAMGFARLVRRSAVRLWTQEELWNGNRESLRELLFGRDSLFLWAIRTYLKHQRTYPALLAEQRLLGKRTIRLRSQRAIDRWLTSLPHQERPGSTVESGERSIAGRQRMEVVRP